MTDNEYTGYAVYVDPSDLGTAHVFDQALGTPAGGTWPPAEWIASYTGEGAWGKAEAHADELMTLRGMLDD